MAKKVFHVVVDEKVTIWRRNIVEVRDCDTLEEAQKKVINQIKEDDMWQDDVVDSELLSDTEQTMSVEENDGYCTTEVMDGNKSIWVNTDKDW